VLKIIINGGPSVGKDKVVEFIRKYTVFNVFNVSTVDKVKEAAKILGWKGVKTPTSRSFLSNLKDLSTDFCDHPRIYIEQSIVSCPDNSIIFIHSREPEEIERFKNLFDTYTLLVRRPIGGEISNHADANVEKFKYDYIIENDGTLDDLFVKTGEFFRKLGEDLDRENKESTEDNKESFRK
jgi:hypothetical protein